jgi:replicative DNA helicase
MPGLHIVSGRPSAGKTTLINNFIRFWCDGIKVAGGVNSMDMTPEMFMMRNVSEKSSVSLPKALKGDLKAVEYDRWMVVVDQCEKWNLDIDCIKDLDQFRSWVTVGVRKKGWKFCVIDFIQLMKFTGSLHMGVNDRIEIISGIVKEIANDLGIPIFALSQLSRDCEKDQRRPTMSDLRGGGSLEQDAKTVLMLWKDQKIAEMWKQCPPTWLAAYKDDAKTNEYMAKRLRPVFAILEKNQDGETGEIPMVMYPNYFRFRLGDYRAETCIVYDEVKKEKIKDRHEAAKFGRVHPDFRQFKEDERFAKAGGLVTEYEDGVE